MTYFEKYARTPTKFEWCGMPVWLVKLTQAEHEEVFSTDLTPPADKQQDKARTRNFYIDVIAKSLVNENGDRVGEAEREHLRTQVAFDDVVALGEIAMRHSGYKVGTEEKKKS